MDVLIIVAVVGALGLLAIIGTLAWAVYVKPRIRRRYERNHHRAKVTRIETKADD